MIFSLKSLFTKTYPVSGLRSLRQTGIKMAAFLLLTPVLVSAASENTLWYSSPASEWPQALPLGNGRMGAMVFGTAPNEIIKLNEESLWAGEQFDSYPDDFMTHLEVVRKLRREGRIAEAQAYGEAHLYKRPSSFRSFEPLGDLSIHVDHKGTLSDYRRELDMENGIVTISYKVGDVRYTREMFISAVDDVMVVRLSSTAPNGFSATVSLSRPKDVQISTSGNDLLLMDGQIIDDDSPEAYDDNPDGSGPGGKHMRFAGRLKVLPQGGELVAGKQSITAKEVNSVSFIFSAATDYNLDMLLFDRSIDPAKVANDLVANAGKRSIDELRRRHAAEHSALYNRATLNLGGKDRLAIPTDERMALFRQGQDDPALITQVFQFGRYLLMSSSRSPGRLPANLQGVWSKKMWAPWEADYHMNINLQMNYWPSDVANLPGTMEPFMGWFEQVAKRGEVSAKTLYGARGWLIYMSSNPFGKVSPGGSNILSQFENGVLDPLCGTWMAMAFWRHYEYTKDLEFLKNRAYPVLKGTSEFIVDTVIDDGKGHLVISPSSSPENSYINPADGKAYRIVEGSTYHNALVREMLTSTLLAAKALDCDPDFQKQLAEVIAKTPGYQIGADGTIMEWPEDYKEAEPDHRHLSHLLGLHPFSQITPDDRDLSLAARRTLERRNNSGPGQVGWGRAWMVGMFARLADGEEAYNHLLAFARISLFPNLLCYFPPVEGGPAVYQIDGNFGSTSCIAEMLLQSQVRLENGTYQIHLLPALPKAWDEGSVKGLRARGSCTIDMTWSQHELTDVVIHADVDGPIPVKYKSLSVELNGKAGETYRLNGELKRK